MISSLPRKRDSLQVHTVSLGLLACIIPTRVIAGEEDGVQGPLQGVCTGGGGWLLSECI